MNRTSFTLAMLLLAVLAPLAAAQKNLSAPSFKPGDTLFYRIHLKIDRDIKTVSALSLPQAPTQAEADVQGILQLEVLPPISVASPGFRFRTWFLALAGDSNVRPPPGASSDATKPPPADNKNKFVDCILTPTGEIDQITGLDALATEQQQAWREWATRFSSAFLIASEKRKRGEKWTADDPETAPSPIAELHWQKKSQYVQDEPCAPLKFTRSGEFQRAANSDSCAAILSTATLLQKSSPKDSTPPDYKEHNLRTSGTANGTDDVLLSISRKNGCLIRATQSATQKMDTLIALADGSTQVRYNITATATSSVELVTDLPLILQPKLAK
ncbi:MAG TPA: hypothetical protein VFP96_00795 [Candidatus Acidoferrum sp.]|nr:hypothetical protein [Candidatus Acidoferrum sp.]